MKIISFQHHDPAFTKIFRNPMRSDLSNHEEVRRCVCIYHFLPCVPFGLSGLTTKRQAEDMPFHIAKCLEACQSLIKQIASNKSFVSCIPRSQEIKIKCL